ncbi:MAG: hypothetical protein ABL912_09085 [Novosphingobium sp.]
MRHPGLKTRQKLQLVALAASLTISQVALAQTVPETIHSDTKGPSTLCGVAGANAGAIIQSVRKMPGLTDRRISSERFELFSSPDDTIQWVFTRPNDPAHPAITCRQIRRDEDGQVWMKRDMRCDADRATCDKLFLEFQNLDGQLKAAMRGE